ncbi:aldehyde dehydrogenase, putative [Talaromyces stipitatus ATCC 10500]|uniref:aldehyde dehydrogenase (NAD(+)) n=1 Tax=Talaromyces stipitatus (strain ATCC 10500 / CBS 375.48 / QM 6759 / NRRL 1006) TaxID=441959 RepID=B8MNA8_TALSN|nr:aldehyde dehydrogenase, putative [Talaromyces stipitatus ATCC 10500]EED13997.1 aldehyde dehydrogenase, putative [Talaromyces stipitatus ATCC 10500]
MDKYLALVNERTDKLQFDRVMGFIERGRVQGTLVTGGHRIGEKGYFIAPTVFTGVIKDSEINQQEIFGPIAIVNSFKTEEEAISLANDTAYGLMAGVLTQDINRALRISTELDTGMVGINAVSMAFRQAPFGGTKESGIGRESGVHALREYTEPKTLFVNLNY